VGDILIYLFGLLFYQVIFLVRLHLVCIQLHMEHLFYIKCEQHIIVSDAATLSKIIIMLTHGKSRYRSEKLDGIISVLSNKLCEGAWSTGSVGAS
jgi:hypothetical protein